MTNLPNPYEAPSASVIGEEEVRPLEAVGGGKRFLNFIIDYICYMIFSAIIGASVGIIFGEAGVNFMNEIPSFILGLPIFLTYYIAWEAAFQRTPGKFATGTIVVSEDGRKPSIGKIFGRSFARLIPFEAFSFFGSESRGWHDSLTKTYVVSCR